MTRRVLIIGGYGNFGRHIARRLALDESLQLILTGRNLESARAFAKTFDNGCQPEAAYLDIFSGLQHSLATLKPDVVVHTSGPYQSQGYVVAKACIEQGCHYVDLSDARQFVAGIGALDEEARRNGVLICAGASSVPCLTAALVDHYRLRFDPLEKIEYGIATAQQTGAGLATTAAVLSYAGKAFKTLIDGNMQSVFGWHDLKVRRFWGLNYRLLGNCDIPDLEIFPGRYPELHTIRFEAGLDSKVLHLGLWFLSWLVRLHLLPTLQGAAPQLLKLAQCFDRLGTNDSGFYMRFSGKDGKGEGKALEFNLVAKQGDGLYIPSMPAILMARKLASGEVTETGAGPCVGFITLDEYLEALAEFDISWITEQQEEQS